VMADLSHLDPIAEKNGFFPSETIWSVDNRCRTDKALYPAKQQLYASVIGSSPFDLLIP